LGVLGPSETANFSGEPEDFCSDITIFNCQFRHADASAFVGSYVDNIRVENNLFSQIDYACANNDVGEAKGFQPSISFRISKGRNLVYRRNTFSVSGNAQTIAASMAGISQKRFLPEKHKPASFAAPIFEYNLNTACGRLHTDGSSLYMAHANQVESVIRYNWFIGNGQRDFRWDGNNKPLQGVHGNLYRNVALDTGVKKFSASGGNGFRVKGSYNEVYNNLGLGRGSELNIATEKGGNAETTTRNNAATHFTDLPIPGVSSHNFTGGKKQRNLKTLLRDISNWDFRPRKDAVELIDKGTPVKCSARGKKLNVTKGFHGKAPDLGAYEYMNNAYWIPGRQEEIASMPIPKDASKTVATDTDLIYLIGLNGTKANVFFGTSSDDLKQVATHVAPNNIVRLSEAKDTQDLKSGTTYYWRVDTENADGLVVPGKLWTFTTE